jgi:deoxyribodipyrimidine photo-lyase
MDDAPVSRETGVQVVWFKRDLRTTDHAPLANAAHAGSVLPLYVAEPAYWNLPDTSARQWLAQRSALGEVSQRLADLGAPLAIRVGEIVSVLDRIHASIGIARLLAHEETGNLWTFERDRAVRAFCRRHGIPFVEFSQTGVIRGLRARDRWARHFADFVSTGIVPEPRRLVPALPVRPSPLPDLADLGLEADGCEEPQTGTRASALRLLDTFLNGRGAHYRRGMSSPLTGADACSRLSVSLATGAISVREVMHRLDDTRMGLLVLPPDRRSVPVTAIDSLTSRLHWRSHFMQKLESEPELEIRSFHPLHEAARRATPASDPALSAWRFGQTGFPFLDACMRSLQATGWLNFRMRAMVQSFASYHLGLDWRASGQLLAQLFVDYEPGIHWPQVQMQSGQTGINTPRIYNPVKQGLDQDPDGLFTRRWIPELADVPAAVLQTPWLLSGARPEAYPAPMVDPVAAMRAARERLTVVRRTAGYRDAALDVFERHGSRKRRIDDDRTQPVRRAKVPRRKGPQTGDYQLSLLFDEER